MADKHLHEKRAECLGHCLSGTPEADSAYEPRESPQDDCSCDPSIHTHFPPYWVGVLLCVCGATATAGLQDRAPQLGLQSTGPTRGDALLKRRAEPTRQSTQYLLPFRPLAQRCAPRGVVSSCIAFHASIIQLTHTHWHR